MRVEKTTGLEHVFSGYGQYVRNQTCGCAHGVRGVSYVHATRANVQDFLKDLAARDAVQLALPNGLEHGARGVTVWPVAADGVEEDIRIKEYPSHGAPRALVSEPPNREEVNPGG